MYLYNARAFYTPNIIYFVVRERVSIFFRHAQFRRHCFPFSPIQPATTMDLTDKICLVTGGAQGIGLAHTENLLKNGAKVYRVLITVYNNYYQYNFRRHVKSQNDTRCFFGDFVASMFCAYTCAQAQLDPNFGSL